MTTTEAMSILGLQENVAVLEDVKPAYRAKAKVSHPDKGGDESEFKKLVAAYELLTGKSKPQLRVVQRPVATQWSGYWVYAGTATTATGF